MLLSTVSVVAFLLLDDYKTGKKVNLWADSLEISEAQVAF